LTRATIQDRSREENWALASRLLSSKPEVGMVGGNLGGFHKLRICCWHRRGQATHAPCRQPNQSDDGIWLAWGVLSRRPEFSRGKTTPLLDAIPLCHALLPFVADPHPTTVPFLSAFVRSMTGHITAAADQPGPIVFVATLVFVHAVPVEKSKDSWILISQWPSFPGRALCMFAMCMNAGCGPHGGGICLSAPSAIPHRALMSFR
jgi:hypothetical protein